ncbi:MAG: dTDP-4-dehydrorhamnose 3,5-epimerase family protein [Helicobacteraceae bacterium]|jgi:dTDP-4-dehydrorhamnose 3,5-epimerase|nr:dTDP-4-dehydrorhamnose 3,5-epimerase family protein [Helicobacteraceae bacterium]
MGEIILQAASIDGLYIGRAKRSGDERGEYAKIFSEAIWREFGFGFAPKEFSVLFSRKGALRGMHFEKGKMGEHPAKIAYCVVGKICAVGVDIRVGSPTFGKYEIVELTADSGAFIYLQEGVAFGTLALENSYLAYIANQNYGETIEGGFIYDDPRVNIPWTIPAERNALIISDRDRSAPSFELAVDLFFR